MTRVPGVYLAVARRRYGDRVLNDRTELMIEGFPRSANTFAVTAFRSAQPRPVRIAHHLHSAAHVLAAQRRDVPVLFLLRRPQDAATSVMVRKPALDPSSVIAAWIHLHERVLPVADRVVVASFEQATSDMGRVTERINDRYHTSFTPFLHDEDHVRACFHEIEAAHRTRSGFLDESIVARPGGGGTTAARARAADAVEQLADTEAMARAGHLYDQYLHLTG